MRSVDRRDADHRIPSAEQIHWPRYQKLCFKSFVGEVGIAGLSEKNPRLICSSDFGASELGNHQVAFAMAFSVLFHLSDELLSKLLNEIRGRLKSSGRFIANVNTDIDDSTWLQFPFLKRSISDYEAVAELAGLSVIQLGTLEQNDFRLLNSERKNVILSFSRRA